jgi:hemoglobin/transferrin/lactoferrin receptor protein
VDNRGGNDRSNANRTAPNPLDYHNGYLLGKAFFTVDATQRLGLTFETPEAPPGHRGVLGRGPCRR